MNFFVNKCSINKYTAMNRRTVGHSISFLDPCIGYTTKGRAEFLYDGKTIFAGTGDLIYIAPETRYYSLWLGEPEIEFYSFSYNLTNISELMQYRFQVIKDFPQKYLDNVYNAKDGDFFELMADFNLLLSKIYSSLTKTSYHPKYIKIKPAIEYIEENYSKNFSINFLADLCHYSEPRFFSLFKEINGVSPITYKHNIMIQHALDLLVKTDISIEEIGLTVGFTSPAYFRKVFLKHTGKTPKLICRNSGLITTSF